MLPATIRSVLAPRPLLGLISAWLLVGPWGLTTEVHAGSFTETFVTDAFRDGLATTANWDTTTTSLALFPFEISTIGSLTVTGSVSTVEVEGNIAYVAARAGGLVLADVGDLSGPSLLGTQPTKSSVTDVAISGRVATLAEGANGLRTVDVSTPTSPAPLGSVALAGHANALERVGPRAYVASDSGLHVVDVSSAAAPTFVSTIPMPQAALDVAAHGRTLLVACGSGGIVTLSVDSLGAVTAADTLPLAAATRVEWVGDVAYVAGGGAGLEVVDVSDPSNLTLLASTSVGGVATGLAVRGDLAYVANGSGVTTLDVSDPSMPQFSSMPSNAGVENLCIVGNVAFASKGTGGLAILRIAHTVASPKFLDRYDTVGNSIDVDISGDVAYLAYGTIGMEALDISDPLSVSSLGIYNTPNFCVGVTVVGDVAYVSDNNSGLLLIDVSDPTTPTLLGSYVTAGIARDTEVVGDLAFVASGGAGLTIVDVSNPTAPTLVGTFDTPGESYGVAVSGDVVYLADRTDGLRIVDVSTPAAPTALGDFDTVGSASDVCVSGDIVYLAGGNPGLQVFDVSNPATPILLTTLDTAGFVNDLWLEGDVLYVAQQSPGILSIDVTTPASPTIVGSFDTSSSANGVAVSGDIAYVADASVLVQVVQVGQHEVDPVPSRGQSLSIDATLANIVRMRLSSVQSDLVSWEQTVDGGATWFATEADSSWVRAPSPGSDLRWGVDLSWNGTPGPSVSSLTIDWRLEPAEIRSVTDTPGDAGGFVDLEFTRSGYDFSEEGVVTITDYVIEREAAVARGGGWDSLATVPATQIDDYAITVPTIADSGATVIYSVYRIVAHTDSAGLFFVSDPDSGFSVSDDPVPVPEIPSAQAPFSLSMPRPNPSRGSVAWSAFLPQSGPVSFTIHDVTGRRVRTLSRTVLPSGSHRFQWDGLDDSGRAAPSGVYFARLESSAGVSSGRIVWTR